MTGQGDDYTIGGQLDYYKMIAIDLSKQQALDADPKAIQQINFTGNLENNAVIFFRFFIRNCKSILILLFALYKMTQYNTSRLKGKTV